MPQPRRKPKKKNPDKSPYSHDVATRRQLIKDKKAQRFAELTSNVREKREELASRGLVDIDLNPMDVLQRAIDDTAGDYAILRAILDEYESPQQAYAARPFLAEYSQSLRSEMTKYATLAMNYNLAERQTRLSEVRVALLGRVLRATLEDLGIPQDTIKQLPKALEKNLNDLQAEIS